MRGTKPDRLDRFAVGGGASAPRPPRPRCSRTPPGGTRRRAMRRASATVWMRGHRSSLRIVLGPRRARSTMGATVTRNLPVGRGGDLGACRRRPTRRGGCGPSNGSGVRERSPPRTRRKIAVGVAPLLLSVKRNARGPHRHALGDGRPACTASPAGGSPVVEVTGGTLKV